MTQASGRPQVKAYDVIIIGAGPAGIFCALALQGTVPDLRILILEKGADLANRQCPLAKNGHCVNCTPCHTLCGWGGAGAFSDGKLTLTTKFGGSLSDYTGEEQLMKLIETADDWYCHFGAPNEVYGMDETVDRELRRRAAAADLVFIPARIRHLGTEKCAEILAAAREHLGSSVTVKFHTTVSEVLEEQGQVKGVRTTDGAEYAADFVVAAPGRSGSEWLAGQAKRLDIKATNSPVDIGVRVEVPAVIMEDITEKVYESKLIYYSRSFDDRIRTFCMCPNGEVTPENTDGLITVNGHSYRNKRTENTNFALLVSKTFSEPFDEPILYGRNIASLANMLGGGVLVQRLGDLLAGRRSTRSRIDRGVITPTLKEATPGDLSLVLPYRHLLGILEMLEALDQLMPGIYSRHTLLYGVEVKFYSSGLQVNKELETPIENLFAVGDGAGITHGLSQASASGIHVAKSIVSKYNAKGEGGYHGGHPSGSPMGG